jgi:Domain of unknown function (DUF4399)
MSAARKLPVLHVLMCAAALAACAGQKPAVAVSIETPVEGDSIEAPEVRITLGVSGIELAPAVEQRAGTAHHHLYLDTDFPELDSPIPAGMPNIVHLGQAQTEYLWQGVLPGPHRIIAVLADPGHVPIKPYVTDTVNFVKR